MDPSIFEKFNALQNMQRQRQAAHQHEEQSRLNRKIQSELQAIRRQLGAEASKPKCPHCGGGAEIGYNVCKNCAREVIWVGNFIGLPGQEEYLRKLHETFVVKQREADNRRVEQQRRAADLKRQRRAKRRADNLATWIAALAWALWFFLFPYFLLDKGYSFMPNLWLWILGMVIVPICVHFGMMKSLNAEAR